MKLKIIFISDSKNSIGFERGRTITTCDKNFACPGNLIQTCGCLMESTMYPMAVDASKIGNYTLAKRKYKDSIMKFMHHRYQ